MTRPSTSSLLDLARRTGLLDPRRVAAITAATTRWGPTLAAPFAASALSTGKRAALVDDHGSLTFGELDRQSTDTAKGLRRLGVRRGGRIGVLCRNHCDFVEVSIAAAKAGLEVVYLNTGFAGPQLEEVARREGIEMLVVDEALGSLEATVDGPIVVVDRTGDPGAEGETTGSSREADIRIVGTSVSDLAAVRSLGSGGLPLVGSMPIAPVLLTSGTTGTPKGARRGRRVDPSSATGILQEIPYRADDVFSITSPLFHAWGLAQLGIAAALGSTVVVSSGFDPEATLRQIERERVTVLAVVPVILQRLLACPAIDDIDLSSLRIVASSGSALPVPVVESWLGRVGPNLYNLYGSTEVGQATLATPSELAAAPDTAGHVLPGSVVRILDPSGHALPTGETGRIFVGNGAQFDGYTGGGGKEIVAGLMSSGDVGHLDEDGLLYVTGRADDMIVSGGENVFPQEVEDLLLAHPDIDDVAVVGVPDDEFGQRLAAHVVRRPGSRMTASRVKALVAEHLARHKVPRDVDFVDRIPRTTTGKIRRADL